MSFYIIFYSVAYDLLYTLPNFLYSRLSLIKEFKIALTNQAFNGPESPTVHHRRFF